MGADASIMSRYLRRVVDLELDELMPSVPAIAIDGPRAVGKTSTASQRAATIHALDDANELRVALGDPRRLVGDQPLHFRQYGLVEELVNRIVRLIDGLADDVDFGQRLPRFDLG